MQAKDNKLQRKATCCSSAGAKARDSALALGGDLQRAPDACREAALCASDEDGTDTAPAVPAESLPGPARRRHCEAVAGGALR